MRAARRSWCIDSLQAVGGPSDDGYNGCCKTMTVLIKAINYTKNKLSIQEALPYQSKRDR